MRKIWIIFLLCFSAYDGNAQQSRVDSLQQLLPQATDLRERYKILDEINNEYYRLGNGSDPGETSFEMVRIGLQLKDDYLIAKSYNGVGDYYCFLKGDNTAALDYFFKAIPYAEKIKNGRVLSSLYVDIAVAYERLKNYEEEHKYLEKAEASLPDTLHPEYQYLKMQVQCNYAAYYASKKMPKELLASLKVAESINARINYPSWELYIRTLYGSYYSQIGQKDSATTSFQQSLELDRKTSFLFAHYSVLYYYIPFLLGNNEFAAAAAESNRLMQIGIKSGNNAMRLSAAEFLKMIYDKAGKTDSAYFYANHESALKDTIFNQAILNKVQALNFGEEVRKQQEEQERKQKIRTIIVFAVIAFIALIALFLYRNNRQRTKANIVLEKTLKDLRSTQAQLIQSEKMASLGELTAGIAHEIQNPLNFVNNFSEVSNELIDEMNSELDKGDIEEAKVISSDIKQNLEKINHHGKRADAIVKGMLQHSQSRKGKKESTDINALADEYLRLAYHGIRAKDNSFNAILKTEYDETIGNINIIPQDIGRVLLNLITNAFYAVDERNLRGFQHQHLPDFQNPGGLPPYEPTITLKTSQTPSLGAREISISISDNGNGIPSIIIDKIFQPFFTTKPTGQGTGLGLSLAYDIVKAHGGNLEVETKEGKGTTFIIRLNEKK